MGVWRTRALLATTPVPKRWIDAAKRIPSKDLLEKDPKLAAFHGDKILAFCASRHLQSTTNPSLRNANNLTQTILSNRYLADRFDRVLPGIQTSNDSSWHSLGTIVEAAIFHVYSKDETAVKELAEWLLDDAPKVGMNSKGILIQLGGTVSVKRIGGSDHNPEYWATAQLKDQTASFKAKTKLDAEQVAAQNCLKSAGHETDAWIYQPQDNRVEWEVAANEWIPFEFRTPLKMSVKGCPVKRWKDVPKDPRKAFAHLMMAPHLLVPKALQWCTVDSWTRQINNESVAVLVSLVYSIDNNQSHAFSVVKLGSSGTKARAKAAQATSAMVLEVLQSRKM